jgi:hypothetical protein
MSWTEKSRAKKPGTKICQARVHNSAVSYPTLFK